MLQFCVNPQVSLSTEQWDFALGMHFSEITAIIQKQTRTIKNCMVMYNESFPLEDDLCIDLVNDGILLIFDSYQQCLKAIEIYELKNVKLSCANVVFNSPEILPTMEQIGCAFGAAVPAVYDKAAKMLNLNFPGISFFFPCEKKPLIKIGMNQGEGSSLIASKIKLYFGRDPDDIPVPDISYCHMSENIFAESIQVLRNNGRTEGLRFQLLKKDESKTEEEQPCFEPMPPVNIYFETPCEQIISELGGPDKIFYKSEDKMKIHGPKRSIHLQRSDFFLNYFSLGLDILIDAVDKVAKKFVLHTNFPGHYDFNIYRRCNFDLPICIEKDPRDIALIDFPEQINISSVTFWKTIASRTKVLNQSIVVNRSSSTNTSNPFGSTYCKAYQDIIFEIIPNGHIASVTLYQLKETE